MNSGSVRPESMGWLHSLEFPSVPSVRYSLIVNSKMETFMFQIANWRKDGENGPFSLSFKDSG